MSGARWVSHSLGAIGLLVAACGSSSSSQADSGGRDASVIDAVVDAGFEDAAAPDAVAMDAAAPDAEEPDSGEIPLGPVTVDVTTTRTPSLLSEFNFFRLSEDGTIDYNEEMFPYELNTALFSDFAEKSRAIYVPAGARIQYRDPDAFDFPPGSAIVKSFFLPADRIIETRVLIKYADGWRATPYLWRPDFSDADRFLIGRTIDIELTDPPRTAHYLIPARNQCLQCHEIFDPVANDQIFTVIGPKARHIHRDTQLERLEMSGRLDGLPDPSTIQAAYDFRLLANTTTTALDDATLEKVARDYLDINCAHCHNPNGTNGGTSRLFLNFDNTDPFNLGICKRASSAGGGTGGRIFDIIPGDPEGSMLVYRVETEMKGAMMPLIGRSLRDEMGTKFVRAWIARMPPLACQ